MTAQPGRTKSIPKWAPWLAVAIPVAAGLIYVLIWYGPDLVARHDIGNVTGPLRVLRLQQARDAARGKLLTLGAGLFAAGALIFTARNSIFAQRTVQATQRTVQLTEQGQVTDRYTKAIDQLGSDKLDVRIGGIYALERITRDSARDHPTVMEVLAAFVREHSREYWPEPAADEPGAGSPSHRLTRADVQAAITVIGRRDHANDSQPIDLRGAYLEHADLARADLAGANLLGAHLAHADLTGADLTSADLTGADLTEAILSGAELSGAQMSVAELTGAYLRHATLQGTNLMDAKLIGTQLGGADLTGADLTNATLTGADLMRALLPAADLTHANCSRTDFLMADLSGANLSKADLHNAKLKRANFSNAGLADAWFPPDAAIPEGWAISPDSGRLVRSAEDSGGNT